jgi:hypothetical protein
LQQHAARMVDIMSAYAQQGRNLNIAALAGAQQFHEWQHYPKQDAVDSTHHSEFYYHAHAKHERPANEHGHFHVFARPGGQKDFHHLVGISLNPQGWPTRLFLTNRWVTGETWVNAQAISPLIVNFNCAIKGRLGPVGHWITGMLHLYQAEILALHQQKDAWLEKELQQKTQQGLHQQQPPVSKKNQGETLDSRQHHVITQLKIDLARDLKRFL